MAIHGARFWQTVPDGRILCTLCPHDCRIAEGLHGACGVRLHHDGRLYTLVYDRVIAQELDPIEKKPLFHFEPGSRAWSIATVGCNLRCVFCQNWTLSQWTHEHLPRRLEWSTDEEAEPLCPGLEAIERIPGEPVTPEGIVASAVAAGADSIAYTYTEPTIFYELAYDTAVLAREAGLKNVFITNGFISEAPLRELAPLLDAANVDLKFFRDETYRRIARARLLPILDAMTLMRALGVWLEVTTLVVPGLNDTDEELSEIARFVAGLGTDVPWHLSRFYPAHQMRDRPATPVAELERAWRLGKEAGLEYVYEGNVPGRGRESTLCPQCGTVLVQRIGFSILTNRIRDGRCPECEHRIAGVGMSGPRHTAFPEPPELRP